MRRQFKLFMACVIALAASYVIFPCRLALAVEDGIIAVVDNEVITVKDMQDYLRSIYFQLHLEGRADADIKEIMGQYQRKGISQLIEDKLILGEAIRQQMQIRPEIIAKRMDEIKKRYPTTQEFIAEINKEGVTISDIQKKIEEQLKAQYIVSKEVRDKIYVNPQDVTDYFNAHLEDYRKRSRLFLESIFVKADKNDEDAAKKINSALEKVRSGEDFKEVAKVYSELPDIGEIMDDSLSPEFKAKTDAMSVGDVSDVIKVSGGLYVVKLTGRTSGNEPLLNDVKDEIYQKLFELKFKESFKAWVEKLRIKSYVEIKK